MLGGNSSKHYIIYLATFTALVLDGLFLGSKLQVAD